MKGHTNKKAQRFPYMKIVRPGAMGQIRGLVLTSEPRLYDIHRYGGRTIPCDGFEDCPFCGILTQDQRSFVPLGLSLGERVFLDLPPTHWEHLVATAERHGSLLGLILTAARTRTASNAPIRISFSVHFLQENPPPAELLDLDERLTQIFERNRLFALQGIETADMAATESPRIDDRASR